MNAEQTEQVAEALASDDAQIIKSLEAAGVVVPDHVRASFFYPAVAAITPIVHDMWSNAARQAFLDAADVVEAQIQKNDSADLRKVRDRLLSLVPRKR